MSQQEENGLISEIVDLVAICVVEGDVTLKAIKAIKGLEPAIRIHAVKRGIRFSVPHGITENQREAWEKIILGIIFVM